MFEIVIPVTWDNNIIRTEMQFFCNDFQKFLRNFPVVNKSYGRSPFTLLKALGKLVYITFGNVISYLKLSIFREFNGVRGNYIKIEYKKDLFQAIPYNIIQENNVLLIIILREQYKSGRTLAGTSRRANLFFWVSVFNRYMAR